MDHFAGLDVSVKETSICIVDDAGKIVPEVRCRYCCQSCGSIWPELVKQRHQLIAMAPGPRWKLLRASLIEFECA